MPVTCRKNPDCLHGLHWSFTTEPALDPDDVIAALERAYPAQLFKTVERWPTGLVTRLVLQFRVEFRVGERPGAVSPVHRLSAPTSVRQSDRAALHALLSALCDSAEAPP